MLYERALGLLRQAVNDPHATFHAGQWEAIEALVRNRARLLVVQRTGWGKSLVYFIATKLLREAGAGPTLLISPLLALMRDQQAAAGRLGVVADSINSTNPNDWRAVSQKVLSGAVDVLLISPERLANEGFREKTLLPIADQVGLFVVDEAHCISDWGHDFRPDYRRITRILQALPRGVASLATTATANDRVVQDIQGQLGPNLVVQRGPLARPSLRLQNISLPSQAARMAWLAEHVPSLPGSGIIYTLTVRDARMLADWLQSRGVDAHAYFGDLDDGQRRVLEQDLLQNRIKALVSTPALGMGFDKPDLRFVIHFQRPGSVVHYYQQVGRAGRKVDEAFGVLLCGEEDAAITDFFIRTAFPSRGEIDAILSKLDDADDGLSVPELEEHINMPRAYIEKALKILATEPVAPVVKRGSRWEATPVEWVLDEERVEGIRRLRRAEQQRMLEYQVTQGCLMAFLAAELNDPAAGPCGRCANCVGAPVVAVAATEKGAREATLFLRRGGMPIEPRKQWAGELVDRYGGRRQIAPELRAERGFAIAQWRDDGWGPLVARGKYEDGRFADELVARSVQAIRETWHPDPFPTSVTCVPSLRDGHLVPDFATRLAGALGLPFIPCVNKVRQTEAQKEMLNSAQRTRNLLDAFAVTPHPAIGGPVLLVDDTVDSGWTFTIIAALLREAGSGPVFPFALASTSSGTDA
jgi:ATP-dependent DNA helicase RecQ